MATLSNILWLGIKELRSFSRDFVLLGLVVWSFSFAVYTQAQSNSQELHNASIAIVDEDRSPLSRQMAGAFLPPYFKPPQAVRESDVDRLMDTAAYTFIMIVPPGFQRDVEAVRVDPIIPVVHAVQSGRLARRVRAGRSRGVRRLAVGRVHVGDAAIVERLEIFDGDRLPLFVGHCLSCKCQDCSPLVVDGDELIAPTGQRLGSALTALAARWAKARIGPSVAPPAQ